MKPLASYLYGPDAHPATCPVAAVLVQRQRDSRAPDTTSYYLGPWHLERNARNVSTTLARSRAELLALYPRVV